MAEKGRVLTGSRAKLLINGKKVGYAKNFECTETLEHAPVEALDNIEVEEHVPVKYRVACSMGFVRVIGESVKAAGIFPKLGANTNEHLRNILQSGDLVIQLLDNQTGTTLALIEQAKATTNRLNTEAGSISGSNIDFVAIRMGDESES